MPAFGSRSALEVPGYKVAVKTGTTDNKKDNWTVGYTPEYLVAVWVGNNDNTPMNPYLTSGITGAAPIWQRTMLYLLQNKVKNPADNQFKKPDNVVVKPCYGNNNEVFIAGKENDVPCAPQRLTITGVPTNQKQPSQAPFQPTQQPQQQWQQGQWVPPGQQRQGQGQNNQGR